VPVSLVVTRTLDNVVVVNDELDICTPKSYTLDVGNYTVQGTYSETGDVSPLYSVTIIQEQPTLVELTFQTPTGTLTVHAKLA
jgi:hypothetical protein